MKNLAVLLAFFFAFSFVKIVPVNADTTCHSNPDGSSSCTTTVNTQSNPPPGSCVTNPDGSSTCSVNVNNGSSNINHTVQPTQAPTIITVIVTATPAPPAYHPYYRYIAPTPTIIASPSAKPSPTKAPKHPS